MYNLLKCEFLKLKSSKLFKYISIAIALISTLMTICEIIGLERYRNEATTNMRLNWDYTFASKLMLPEIVLLIGSIFIIGFICNDFNERIVQSEICSGYSKFKILLSKTITSYIVMGLFSLINAIMGTIVVALFYGFEGNISLNNVPKILILYCVSTLLICAFISIAIMTAYIFKFTGIACVTYFIIKIFYTHIPGLIEDAYKIDVLNEKSYLPDLCEQLSLEMTSSFVYTSIIQCLIFIIVFFLITYKIFERSELR